MSLKRGSAVSSSSFSNSMAQEIEDAFIAEWNAVKGTPLPDNAEQDRKIMFAAVAQGVLNYLHAHRDDMPTTQNSDHRHDMDFDIS
jgi:hypothetical protein